MHGMCYRAINNDNENENSVINILTGEDNRGTSDFDLDTYLSECIPISNQVSNEDNQDRIGAMIGRMNETDKRILNLMDYYEKQ